MRNRNIINVFTACALTFIVGRGVGYTQASPVVSEPYFTDIETSIGIPLAVTTLDMKLSAEEDYFSEGYDSMYREEDVEREFKVKNVGESAFSYSLDYEYSNGSSVLCNALNLEVFLVINSAGDRESKYQGLLKNFNNYDTGEILDADDSKSYVFEISVPGDASYEISSKTCEFKIFATAWQDNLTSSLQGFSDEESITSEIKTANWPPLAPTGLTVINADGKDIGCDGLTNDTTLTFDWSNNSEFDIDKYQVEIDGEASLLEVTTSDTSVSLGGGDGNYKYHVKALDVGGAESPWSDWCNMELDTGISDSNDRDVVINEVMWSSSSEDTSDAWIELYNNTDSDISLNGWKFYGAGAGGDALTLSGTIDSKEYFLISRYKTDDLKCAINDSISSDLQSNNLDLSKSGERLILENVLGQKVDETPDVDSGWAAGEVGSGKWRSMERTEMDVSGSASTNWHTCMDDVCNDTTYWDDEGDDYGTPKAENHSGDEDEENEEESAGLVSLEPPEVGEEVQADD